MGVNPYKQATEKLQELLSTIRQAVSGVIPRRAWRDTLGKVDFVNGLRQEDNGLNARQYWVWHTIRAQSANHLQCEWCVHNFGVEVCGFFDALNQSFITDWNRDISVSSQHTKVIQFS